MGCAVPTGMGAVRNTAKVEIGSTVAVFGLGAVGMAVIQGAKMVGAKRIIGINPNDFDEPIHQVIIGMTDGGVLGRSQLPGMVDEWLRGDFDVDPYITHNMTHDQINTAFDLLHAGESIRSVIHFQPQDTMLESQVPCRILPS